MSLHSVEPFAYDRIFAAPPPDAKPGPDRTVEFAALRAELAALKADQGNIASLARAEGFEAGQAQARAERETALLSAIDALQAGIETLDAQFDALSQRVTGEAAEIALAAADMLAGRALADAPCATIDEAIGRALHQVARGTELTVRVHPDLIEGIEAAIAERQANDRRKLNLIAIGDVTLAVGDAVIGWEQGGLALDGEARRKAVLAELASLLPPAFQPTDDD